VRISLVAAGAVLLVAAACGGTTPGGGSPSAPAGGVACDDSVGSPVAVADFAYNPANASIAVGGSLTWANADTAPHTVTFDGGPDCGRMATGGTVSATFGSAGTFTYHCTIHPQMEGTVTVQ
jgi:plastocyanin